MAAVVTIDSKSVLTPNSAVPVFHDESAGEFGDAHLYGEDSCPGMSQEDRERMMRREEQDSYRFMATGSSLSPYTSDSVHSFQEIFENDNESVRRSFRSTGEGNAAGSGNTNASATGEYEIYSMHQHDHELVSPELMTPPIPKGKNCESDLGTPPTSLHTSTSMYPGVAESLHFNISPGTSQKLITAAPSFTPSEGGNDAGLSMDKLDESSSTPRSFSINPVVYSAIGSLEAIHDSTSSSLNQRIMKTTGRDFAARRGPLLIPPANQLNANGSKQSQNLFSNQNYIVLANPAYGNSSNLAGFLPPSSTAPEKEKKDNGTINKQSSSSDAERVKTSKGKDESNLVDLSTNKFRSAKTNLRTKSSKQRKNKEKKSVSIDKESLNRKKSKKPQQVELFRPSCDAYTPRMGKKKITYKPAEMRTPVQSMATTMGTLSRPNFRDALRRVAMLIHQHIVKIERRFEGNKPNNSDEGLFKQCMKEEFLEDNFATPTYKCTVVRLPMARPGVVFGQRKIRTRYLIPSEEEIYDFAHRLFKSVQLSSECSIVCLIYVERLMEIAKVPLLATTWRPIFMCGLLLASKVWQDLSSWNIEFASVYPRFSLDAINRLELLFLRRVKWDLYISSSLYAKYYFALRSIVEKRDFRQRYNRMVGGVGNVAHSEALKIQKRTELVKEEALLQLSCSM